MQITTEHGILIMVRDGRMICPVCGGMMQGKIMPSTRLTDFPAYCKHCRKELIVNTAPAPQRQRQ